MRIDKLHIASFKNLRDFSINYDQGSLITVLVGRNGTGKSNLLEALVIIFRDLDLGEGPAFKYSINYKCRNNEIVVDADPDRAQREAYRIQVNSEAISIRNFSGMPDRQYLPNYVFGYYSGPSNRLEQHFEKHQNKFYDELLKGNDKALRPLLYARLAHSQFALLAFFNEHDEAIMKFLDTQLRIQALDSVLFVMRQPPWKSRKGDARFWFARGTVQHFLARLLELSLAPIRLKQPVRLDFREKTSLEHLYLYLPSAEELHVLAGEYPDQQQLFKALESTYISKLISEVRIRVKVRGTDDTLTFRELSEGEQQLLMVLGLLRFTQEEESLFLLDEPDTHLNPAWSLQYIDFLYQVAGNPENSHIIMTTHDPLTIAGLLRSQVQLIQRDEVTGKITAQYPEQDPRGMGVAGLLTSDIYGLRSQLDTETMQMLDERRKLALRNDELSAEEKQHFAALDERLASLGFTQNSRDPLYAPFVKAMTKVIEEERLTAPILTNEQQERQLELAKEIIKDLRLQRE